MQDLTAGIFIKKNGVFGEYIKKRLQTAKISRNSRIYKKGNFRTEKMGQFGHI